MIVADSDVLIDYLRGAQPLADRVEIELKTRSFGTTTVTVFELWAGAHSPKQIAAIEHVLDAMILLPLDIDAARHAGEVRRDLIGRGLDIGAADCLIAGICLTRGATLLTKNKKHFERVPGLKLSLGAV